MKTAGELLKKARDKRGLSLEEVEKSIRVRRKYLKALEKGDYQKLPGFSYAQGFVRVYAEFLGESPEKILPFLRREYPVEEPKVVPRMAEKPLKSLRLTSRLSGGLALAGLMTLLVLVWLFWQWRSVSGAPTLEIFEPADKKVIETLRVQVAGRADPMARVTINDQEVETGENGSFEEEVMLTVGLNEIVIEATNKFGKVTSKKIQVRSEP